MRWNIITALLLFILSISFVSANTMNSSNYVLSLVDFGSGGELNASSTNYKAGVLIGGEALGESTGPQTSTTFTNYLGFFYEEFIQPVITVITGGGGGGGPSCPSPYTRSGSTCILNLSNYQIGTNTTYYAVPVSNPVSNFKILYFVGDVPFDASTVGSKLVTADNQQIPVILTRVGTGEYLFNYDLANFSEYEQVTLVFALDNHYRNVTIPILAEPLFTGNVVVNAFNDNVQFPTEFLLIILPLILLAFVSRYIQFLVDKNGRIDMWLTLIFLTVVQLLIQVWLIAIFNNLGYDLFLFLILLMTMVLNYVQVGIDTKNINITMGRGSSFLFVFIIQAMLIILFMWMFL